MTPNTSSILDPYQIDAAKQLTTGSILWGGVGSGKSLTSLHYYHLAGENRVPIVITTAKKRDSGEWEAEAKIAGLPYILVDSWNNIAKWTHYENAFFIFDEQRLVGSGKWVKSFYKIAKKNMWILLTATPGDSWPDYIPVFVANGFYKNKTDFMQQHAIYRQNTKYPCVDKWMDTKKLEWHRQQVLVHMEADYVNPRKNIQCVHLFPREQYQTIMKTKWNPYKNAPIQNAAELVFTLRQCVNSSPYKIGEVSQFLNEIDNGIVFYNYNYELEILRTICKDSKIAYSEWNGQYHQPIRTDEQKWVYLVQYSAGAEGWNCIDTDTVIFFSENYSYKIMEQASGRIDRRNTPFEALKYYTYRSNAPVDNAVHAAILRKEKFNENAFIKM